MAEFVPDIAGIEEINQSPGVWTLLDAIGQEGTAIAKRLVLVNAGNRSGGEDDIPGRLRDSIRYRFTVEGGVPEVQIGSDSALNDKGEVYTLHVEYGQFNTADLEPKGAFLRPTLMALRIP